jgi:general secretion pathway protein M
VIGAWISTRSRSERIGLGLLVVVVFGAAYFLLVWEPLSLAHARLVTRVAAEHDLARYLTDVSARARLLEARQTPRTPYAGDVNLLTFVTAQARAAGVQAYTRKLTPSGADAINLMLENVPFSTLAGWLVALDEEHGVEVERINVSASKAAGLVMAQIMLRARRG